MIITILTDNNDSWIIPYVDTLKDKIQERHTAHHVYDITDVQESDILFILSCENIITRKQLDLCGNNIVIHPSLLPKGRGWSPLAWQILENSNRIPMSLFEASECVDSGDVYMVDYIELRGSELNEELKQLQGKKTIDMALSYINQYPMKGQSQKDSESTYYSKRDANSSELDVHTSICDNFNTLRVVDNDRYPAFFLRDGKKYIIKVYEV